MVPSKTRSKCTYSDVKKSDNFLLKKSVVGPFTRYSHYKPIDKMAFTLYSRINFIVETDRMMPELDILPEFMRRFTPCKMAHVSVTCVKPDLPKSHSWQNNILYTDDSHHWMTYLIRGGLSTMNIIVNLTHAPISEEHRVELRTYNIMYLQHNDVSIKDFPFDTLSTMMIAFPRLTLLQTPRTSTKETLCELSRCVNVFKNLMAFKNMIPYFYGCMIMCDYNETALRAVLSDAIVHSHDPDVQTYTPQLQEYLGNMNKTWDDLSTNVQHACVRLIFGC